MKKIIKSLTPPLMWDKMMYLRSYKHFLKYKDLVTKNSALKDIHKGKRCFILGSGPSIKKENLKPLKNEIVFALNNFYVHEDFQEIMGGNLPKYYMTAPVHSPQTEDEWKIWFEDMEKYIPKTTNMLFGLNSNKMNIKNIFEKYEIFKDHKINWYFAGINTSEYYYFKQKDIDITNMIWSANTVSIYALIVAIYMGFDEIYLLGMDHTQIYNKQDNVRFYKNADFQKKEKVKQSNESYVKQYMSRYFQWKQYNILGQSGANIINLSEDSILKLFPFNNLKRILK